MIGKTENIELQTFFELVSGNKKVNFLLQADVWAFAEFVSCQGWLCREPFPEGGFCHCDIRQGRDDWRDWRDLQVAHQEADCEDS
jgi:hypothetical protein